MEKILISVHRLYSEILNMIANPVNILDHDENGTPIVLNVNPCNIQPKGITKASV